MFLGSTGWMPWVREPREFVLFGFRIAVFDVASSLAHLCALPLPAVCFDIFFATSPLKISRKNVFSHYKGCCAVEKLS